MKYVNGIGQGSRNIHEVSKCSELPALLNGTKTWTTSRDHWNKILTAYLSFSRKDCGIRNKIEATFRKDKSHI
jgi:hypothetical protein